MALLSLLGLLILAVWLGEKGGGDRPDAVTRQKPPAVVFEESGAGGDETAPPPAGEKAALPAEKHIGIALILDDVGYDLPALRRALALKIPMAVAILPDAPHAVEAAKLAHAAGDPVMLHMPMEPGNPHYQALMDQSFLRVGMPRREVRRVMDAALQHVPYVVGVNNHMGSLLTTLEEPMRWVMEVCREHKLFFVDSRTNKDSVAARLAREAGLRWGERRVFLDDSVKPEKLEKSWESARRRLAKHGFVIVIAHPHRETLDFLTQDLSAKDRAAMVPLVSLLSPAEQRD